MAAICAFALSSTMPAVASTAPLRGLEWWFDAWQVQTDIWPHTQGAGVTVAVLDSGVATVPDLAGVVLPGYNAVDHRGDGRHNIDKSGHGTLLASLIAGQGTATGMLGIAPKAKVLPVIAVNSADHFTEQDVAEAIRWAADHGAKVINMSLGGDAAIGGCPPTVQAAVRHAILDTDIVVVASAGNTGDADNGVQYPADCAGVVAVGAVDRQARPWPKSQRQPYVDVAAPGVDMAGVDSTGRLSLGLDGTSGSAALTSAGIALIRSAHPELNGRQVVARLLATLRDRPPDGQKDPQRGYGTILLNKAVNDSIPADAPNPIYDELGPGTHSGAPTAGPARSGPAAGAPTRPSDHAAVVIAVLAVAGVLVVGGLVVLAARRRRHPPHGARYPPGPTYRPTAGGQPYQPPAGGPPYQPPRQAEHSRPVGHGQPGGHGRAGGHGRPRPHPPPAPPTGRPGS